MNIEQKFECIQKAVLKSTELSKLGAEQIMRSEAQSMNQILTIIEIDDMWLAYKKLAARQEVGIGSVIQLPKGIIRRC